MTETNNSTAQSTEQKQSVASEQTTVETPVNDAVSDTAKLIADLEAKVKANLDLAKYQKAEFENYKRRNQNAVTAAFQDGQSYVVNLLLPIYDGVVEAGKKIADPKDLEGFEIIRKKLDDLFQKVGIEPIVTKDQTFDPKLHNAVAVEKVEGVAPDQILEEWQTGFMFHDRVLRPAMVKVSGA